MDQIIIQVKNRKKARVLIDYLKTLDFVSSVNTDMPIAELKEEEHDSDFFALAGIWKNRDITFESIHKNAWLLNP